MDAQETVDMIRTAITWIGFGVELFVICLAAFVEVMDRASKRTKR